MADGRGTRATVRMPGCKQLSTRKAAAERPGLTAALGYVRQGDTLVVWELDRLGRSVKEGYARPQGLSAP